MNELLGALISATVVLAGTGATTWLAISAQRSTHRRVENIKRAYEVLDAAHAADDAGSEDATVAALRHYIRRESTLLRDERTIERNPTRFWAVLLVLSIAVSVLSAVFGGMASVSESQPWLGIGAALIGVWLLTWVAVPASAAGLIIARTRVARERKAAKGAGLPPAPTAAEPG